MPTRNLINLRPRRMLNCCIQDTLSSRARAKVSCIQVELVPNLQILVVTGKSNNQQAVFTTKGRNVKRVDLEN